MNILIAEDNLMIQHLHRALMKSWGFDFDMASDGLEAIELVEKNKGLYDLCLMDIDMPRMNGIEATKVIRKISRYFPIMALTANNSYQKACYEVGMDDFAQKPCPPNDLFDRINKLTIKLYKFIIRQNDYDISEVMPVDQEYAQELRELAKKNLRKITFFDNPSRAVVVHSNVMNRISHDFNVKGQMITTFINRDSDKPSLCHLFKNSNYLLPQTMLTEEEYAAMIEKEDIDLGNYPDLSLDAEDK